MNKLLNGDRTNTDGIVEWSGDSTDVGSLKSLIAQVNAIKTIIITGADSSGSSGSAISLDDFFKKTGGDISGSIRLVSADSNVKATLTNDGALTLGFDFGTDVSGANSIFAGRNHNFTNFQNSIVVGGWLKSAGNYQFRSIFGQYNVDKDRVRITGWGSGEDSRKNIEELSSDGTLYVSKGFSNGITTIPAATSEYTLSEGTYRHSPASQPTYTLPAVTDTSSTHVLSVKVNFSYEMSSAPIFLDSDGVTTITPIGDYDLSTTAIVDYLCEYDDVVGWSIFPLMVRE